MDRFPSLRQMISEEFGTVYQFARETGIPKATVIHLLLGNLGERAEVKAQERIEEAFGRLRPERNLSGLWIRQDPQEANNLVLEIPPGTRKMRINISIHHDFE